ncbi:hypothetical protein IC232_04265 [Microvirga sp. BT688]|uniref:hypothetical protein n=1 Tax=Microvirga sp. TaxID=1873136 RepID=UPI001681CFDC|nr:hypothetical protein [Microvirga sp.]MBD2745908.1 hypothetical protein [Microvirga sp.]
MLRAENDNLPYDQFKAGVQPGPSIAPVRQDATVIFQGRIPGGFITLQKRVRLGPDGVPILTAAPMAMMPHPECPPNRLVAPQMMPADRGLRQERPAYIRGVVVNQEQRAVEIC